MKTPAIYPIYLSSGVAKALIEKHFWREFDEALRMTWGHPTLEYSAKLKENGEVDLHVHYTSDDSFCMSSGRLMNATCRPYDDARIAEIVDHRKFLLAQEEYARRKEDEITQEILRIQAEMFPEVA